MQTALIAIFIFGILIFVHEFGHFIVAKLVGIRVEEFSIGMGPKAFSSKKGETYYSVRLLPIGGYVKMTGETGLEEEGDLSYNDPRRFNNKSILERAAVIVAGAFMNFVLAIVIFTFIFAIIGMPYISTEIDTIIKDSPAEKAGLKPKDVIVSIEGKKVDDWSEMVEIIHNRPGEKLKFIVNRNGEEKEFLITPKFDPEKKVGLIGITPTEGQWKKVNIFKAFTLGISRTIEIIVLTFTALVQLITGNNMVGDVTGPVGIIKLIGESARVGILYVANLTALISINLGILNLLPIPALDGSKLIFLGIEAVRGKPIDAKKENFVHLIGFALLMLLMLVVTYRDIIRLF